MFSDEFKGHSLLEGARQTDLGRVGQFILWQFILVCMFSDEFKGHSLLEGARQTDLGRVKKYLDVVSFKHPYTGDTALVRIERYNIKGVKKVCSEVKTYSYYFSIYVSNDINVTRILKSRLTRFEINKGMFNQLFCHEKYQSSH